jgi:ABC-type polysaccharide/polyol phosphate export permease
MAFFSGTFFPVDRAPTIIKWIIYIMPLTHTNILIRSAHLDGQGIASLAVLLVYTAGFFAYGSHLIRSYSE